MPVQERVRDPTGEVTPVELARRVGRDDLQAGPQTAGIVRLQAFEDGETWFGEARTEPGMSSGWHHHAEHCTYVYVVQGRLRLESGPGGREVADLGPGEYAQIPPHAVHRESNPADEESLLILARRGSGPTVVNVDGPDPT